jgi:NAD(P)-dependent dehydrogenase (short-subunit alcohol dehydrogenase family)
MSESVALTARSTIGAWLDDPTGGPLIGGLLERSGIDPQVSVLLRGLPLQNLVTLSQGQLPVSVIDDLVRQANGGDIPRGAAATVWEEQITPGRFAGRTVIVTGAASGIGRATASRIAREGGRVIAVDVAQQPLEAFAESLPDADIVAVRGDITDQASVDAVVAAAGGTIDGLANIAGIIDDYSPLGETSDAIWDRVLAVNLTGTFKLTRAVVPVMLAAGRGAVVSVASEAGLRGNASGNAYTASKHAIIGLTRSAAFMYGPTGLRFSAIAPGAVATGISTPAQVSEYGSKRLAPFQAQIPSMASAAQIAASITFMLSEDGADLNGAILTSDGGRSVQ